MRCMMTTFYKCRRVRVCAVWVVAGLALSVGRSFGQAKGASAAEDFVSVVSGEGMIDEPANLFNLRGKTLRFTPTAGGGYTVENLPRGKWEATTRVLGDAEAQGPKEAKGWAVPLPFKFPFGGQAWDRVFVNRNGNISFGKPEADSWQEHNPWSDGGMCSVASAIDSRAAAGLEQMIAAFYGVYDPESSQVSTRVTADELAVTWKVTRMNWGKMAAGPNVFQARLMRSGVIELAYSEVRESDGIVGVFTGTPVSGKVLSHWQNEGKGKGGIDVDSADIVDAGSVLKFAVTMKEDAATYGTLAYRCMLHHDGFGDEVSVNVKDPPHASTSLKLSPTAIGYRVEGKTVEMFLSKLCLAGCGKIEPAWNVIGWGQAGKNFNSGKVDTELDPKEIGNGEADFSKPQQGTYSGNVFEVFHYARVNKKSGHELKVIYQTVPATDDIALVFTDFRIDDFYGIGGGASAENFAIQGIGRGAAHPRSTEELGSKQLQMHISTVWIGKPGFMESGTEEDGRRWFNFAHPVKWIAHECTHRWGIHLRFIDPTTGKEEQLSDDTGHWLARLNTASVYPVAGKYVGRPEAGYSIMGGSAWRENADGTFSKSDYPRLAPGGYSALDLYVMGLLPAENVPPTFLLKDVRKLGRDRVAATKVPVRIEDIVAAMGKRIPPASEAQKTFRMTFYLIREPGRPVSPAGLAKARKLSKAVVDFFTQATGGAMKVVPGH